jgi:hypothetical protein
MRKQTTHPNPGTSSQTASKSAADNSFTETLPMWVVSLVMIKTIPTGINLINKLLKVEAANKNEAHGKALTITQKAFPHHQLHSILSFHVGRLPDDVPATDTEKQETSTGK